MADGAHEPKLRALAAYTEARLGAAGRARVERHLAGCAVCREALAGMRRYGALLDDVRDAELPALDWRRLEMALSREGATLARKRRMQQLAVPLALAAAAGLALVVARGGRDPASPTAPQARAPQQPAPAQVEPEARALALRLTAVQGPVFGVDPAGQRTALTLEAQLGEGWALETGSGAELHLALERAAALALAPGSLLRVVRAREGDVELALERGRVVHKVQPLAPGGRYETTAAGHVIAVRGTHFAVELLEPGLAVQVDEGVVAVLKDQALLEELRAPRRWQLGQAPAPAAAGTDQPLAALPLPRAASAAATDWPALQLPAWPRALRWDIDATSLAASGELQMRVPPGKLELGATLRDGRQVRVVVTIDPMGSRFDPRALRWIGDAPVPGAEPARELDPAQAAAVIRAAQPDLQRCYERSLRQQALDGALRARLRLGIDPRGAVRQVELHSEVEVPEGLAQCVRDVAGRWLFEAPGGVGITFEAPIAFHPRN